MPDLYKRLQVCVVIQRKPTKGNLRVQSDVTPFKFSVLWNQHACEGKQNQPCGFCTNSAMTQQHTSLSRNWAPVDSQLLLSKRSLSPTQMLSCVSLSVVYKKKLTRHLAILQYLSKQDVNIWKNKKTYLWAHMQVNLPRRKWLPHTAMSPHYLKRVQSLWKAFV